MAAPSSRLTPEALARIGSLELRARHIVEGFITGMHRSPYHGFSVEFAQHRAYNAGDELRHVDWKVWARKDRWVVKQYEEETNLRHAVVLDTSASMRYAGAGGVSKLEYGATLAAALHTLMVRQRDATGLASFSGAGVDTLLPPRSTRSHLRALLATLDRLASGEASPPEASGDADGGGTAVARALSEVAERLPRRSLVTVVSDLFETVDGAAEVVRALRHLRHRGHEVLVFHVLDAQTERFFDFPDRPVRLRDLETGERVTLQPAQIRERYREHAEAFFADVRRRCREIEADYEILDTAKPYSLALSAYLAKRKRLH